MINFKTEHHLFEAAKAAYQAGEKILEVYNLKDFEVESKQDNSPLTLADKRAHETIIKALKESQIPVLSEEGIGHEYNDRKNRELFWLVDPLDGTKEFIKKNDEFTVNIALIHKDIPIAGIIYVPVFRLLYFGDVQNGAFKKSDISPDDFAEDKNYESLIFNSQKLPIVQKTRPYTAVASRSHLSEETKVFLSKLEKKHGKTEIISKGSSLKICMVAEGKADIYPRFGPTMEWDTGAGDAIARASGASVTKTDGTPLLYNKENLLNPYFIVERKS
jgi:3'(2'), 5'-bisphosphate nucleotidase